IQFICADFCTFVQPLSTQLNKCRLVTFAIKAAIAHLLVPIKDVIFRREPLGFPSKYRSSWMNARRGPSRPARTGSETCDSASWMLINCRSNPPFCARAGKPARERARRQDCRSHAGDKPNARDSAGLGILDLWRQENDQDAWPAAGRGVLLRVYASRYDGAGRRGSQADRAIRRCLRSERRLVYLRVQGRENHPAGP